MTDCQDEQVFILKHYKDEVKELRVHVNALGSLSNNETEGYENFT